MLIAASGKKRSGKDTFYDIIKTTLGSQRKVHRLAFADEVKSLAEKYFGVSYYSPDKEKTRFVLQGIGQMFREEISPTFWVDIVAKKYKSFPESDICVVTDCRYINELEWARSLEGSVTVRILRPDTDCSTDIHPSETELDGYDFPSYIFNAGDLKEYTQEVRGWIRIWLQ